MPGTDDAPQEPTMKFDTHTPLDDQFNGLLLGVVIAIVVVMGVDAVRDNTPAIVAASATTPSPSLPSAVAAAILVAAH